MYLPPPLHSCTKLSTVRGAMRPKSSKRSGNLLLRVDGSLFTFGGFGVPMKHDAYCLPRGAGADAAWLKLEKAPWHGRFDYDMALVNGTIVLLGGEASLFGTGGPYFNDVWQWDAPTCAAF